MTARLEDYNFADDIALLSHTHKDIQEKTDKVDKTARSVGLRIYPGKTKVMKVKNKSIVKTNVRGTELKGAQDFKYLGWYI